MNSEIIGSPVFEGLTIPIVTYRGRPSVLIAHIEAALGYEPKSLSKLMRQEWAAELEPDVDFAKVQGDELADLRGLLGACGPGLGDVVLDYRTSPRTGEPQPAIDPRTASALLLFETGLNIVCIKTEMPAGVRLRRWLATEVLPSLRRTGAYATGTHRGRPEHSESLELVRARRARLEALRDLLNPPPVPKLRLAILDHFQGRPLSFLLHHGRPALFLRELEAAIGAVFSAREAGGELAQAMRHPERHGIYSGQDFATLDPHQATRLRAVLPHASEHPEWFNGRELLLYETGVDRLTAEYHRTPHGFRAWFAGILPAVRELAASTSPAALDHLAAVRVVAASLLEDQITLENGLVAAPTTNPSDAGPRHLAIVPASSPAGNDNTPRSWREQLAPWAARRDEASIADAAQALGLELSHRIASDLGGVLRALGFTRVEYRRIGVRRARIYVRARRVTTAAPAEGSAGTPAEPEDDASPSGPRRRRRVRRERSDRLRARLDGWIEALGDWPTGRAEATTDELLEVLGLGGASGRELHTRRMNAGVVLRRLGFTRTLQRRDDGGSYERRIYARPVETDPLGELLAPWLADRTEANVSDAIAFLGLDVAPQNGPTARRIVEAFRRAGFTVQRRLPADTTGRAPRRVWTPDTH